MTRKQKLRYIWEYYWLPIVGITAGVLFLIYFLYHLLFATKEYWFYVTFVNIRPQTGVESELMDEFVSERGYDLSKKNVFFNDACYFDATSAATALWVRTAPPRRDAPWAGIST